MNNNLFTVGASGRIKNLINLSKPMTYDCILNAVNNFEAKNGKVDTYSHSTTYDLVVNDKRYPPKAIFGLALSELINKDVLSSHFCGGDGSPCFITLERLGFPIILKNDDGDDEDYQTAISIRKPAKLPKGAIPLPNQGKKTRNNKWNRNPSIAKNAIENTDYKCEIDNSHLTFISRKTNHNYVEAHHLIPMEQQSEFKVSIDVPENILSLCPNCHKQFHHSSIESITGLLRVFYEIRKQALLSRKISVEFEQLTRYYAKP